jgi:hypothetical protein
MSKIFSPSKQQSSQASTVSLPAWLSDTLQGNSQAAQALSKTPFQAFSGPSFTPINDTQNAASGITAGVAGYAPGQVTAGQIGDTDLSRYTDPYTQQVIDAAGADIDRSTAQAQERARGSAATAGAFGGDRAAIEQAELAGQGIRSKGNISAQLRSQGFNNAQAAATADINRRMTADTANVATGLQGQQLNLGAAQQLFGQGEVGREAEEAGRQFDYGEFQRGINDPFNKLSWAQGIASGTAPYYTTQSTTSTTPGPSAFGQILGAAGSIAGIAGLAGLASGGVADDGMHPEIRAALGRLYADGGVAGYAGGGEVEGPWDYLNDPEGRERVMRPAPMMGDPGTERYREGVPGLATDPGAYYREGVPGLATDPGMRYRDGTPVRPERGGQASIDETNALVRRSLPRASGIAAYEPLIDRAAAENNIPPALLRSMILRESGGNPNAVGGAGETGIAQILPSTARQPGYGLPPISEADTRDPEKAIPWAARYLAARARSAGVTDWSDPAQAGIGMAAYNGAGPQAARYGREVVADAGMAGGAGRDEAPSAGTDTGDEVMGAVPAAAPGTSAPASAGSGIDIRPTAPRKDNNALWLALLEGGGKMLASRAPGISNVGEGIAAGAESYRKSLGARDALELRREESQAANALRLEGLKEREAAAKLRSEDTRLGIKQREDSAAEARRVQLEIAGMRPEPSRPEEWKPATREIDGAKVEGQVSSRGEFKPYRVPQDQSDNLTPARAWGDVYNLAPKVADGTATPDEVRRYGIATHIVTQPRFNPATQSYDTPTLPEGFPAPSATIARPQGAAVPERPGPAVATDQPPARPEAGGRISATPTEQGKIRAVEAEASKVFGAIQRYRELVNANGGTGINAYINNPRSPEAGKILTAYNNLIMELKAEPLYNLGVLNVGDLPRLQAAIVDPQTLRGALAAPSRINAQLGELEGMVLSSINAQRRTAGLAPVDAARLRGAAPSAPEAPRDPAERKPNTVYQTPKGPLMWTGTGWSAAQ